MVDWAGFTFLPLCQVRIPKVSEIMYLAMLASDSVVKPLDPMSQQ